MNRLIFSDRALTRKLEISRVRFFAFVEGGLDRPFCDRLLTRLLAKDGVKYQVVAAKELPGDTGGKPRLQALYRKLRRANKLKIDWFGKTAVCAFFLDKDIDDWRRRILRSEHVIYTSAYDLEGELFKSGDLHRATADASGMTLGQAAQLLGPQDDWLCHHQRNWLDWITLCIISQVKQVNVGCTFDRPSAINGQLLDACDPIALAQFKQNLASKLDVSLDDFERIYRRYWRAVRARISSTKQLQLFKGKWLPVILEREVATKNQVPDVLVQALGQKVVSALVSQVGNHAQCRCCATYEQKLTPLVAHLA